MQGLLDMLVQQLQSQIPLGKLSKQGNELTLELDSNDLTRLFTEQLSKSPHQIPMSAINVKIENNRIVIAIRVV